MGMTLKDFENKFREFVDEFNQFKRSQRKAPECGKVITVAGIEWIVLDKLDAGYFSIAKDFISESEKFDGNTNNWAKSSRRKYLNTDFLKKIEEDIGEGVLPEFERDLTSLDGQTEYGKCMDKVSMPTVDEYRKYRKYLPNMKKWMWFITPWSTPCNECETLVTVVSPFGFIFRIGCNCCNGVRPVCIFPSSIFESEDE